MCAYLPMNQLALAIAVLLLFGHVKAQETSDGDHSGPNFLKPSLIIVVGVLSAAFCLIFLILAYAKFCHAAVSSFSDLEQPDRSRPRSSGIDKKVMESLPFFRFSSLKGSKEGLECAVCLSKFEEMEVLRLLPICRHAFHINCIDQWLENHSSCPLCRHKFDARDLQSFSYSNSLRFTEQPLTPAEEADISLHLQRQQDDPGSSRYRTGSSFHDVMNKGKKEEGNDQKLWHEQKHKKVFSNMINETSPSNRFPSLESNNSCFPMDKHVPLKKMKPETKYIRINRSYSVCNSIYASTSTNEANTSRLLNPGLKRSMSEFKNFSRFTESNTNSSLEEITQKRTEQGGFVCLKL